MAQTDHVIFSCPFCKNDNSHEYWDAHTKRQQGIKPAPEGTYISCKAPVDVHIEQETEYNCPICNRIVPGAKMIKEGEVTI